jgi:hypothetical protein
MDETTLERPAPGPDPDGVGAIRRFRTGRTTSREEVLEFEPDRHLAYTLLSGLPLKDYRATVDLRPDGTGTAITWRSTFRPKFPGTGWIYRLALGKFLERLIASLAAATTSTS